MWAIKSFELSSRVSKNGQRKFKLVLHEVYPDSVVDELSGVGSQFNRNGICWIKKYCEQNLDTIKGKSLRCEFLDEERTELCGHGETDIIDGEPIFENATMIGTFSKAYIEDSTDDYGNPIMVCIGEGSIDSSCYHNLCESIDRKLEKGEYPVGSVEILKTDDNDCIKYLSGHYVDEGRIPTEFQYSGYALLGVTPADRQAKLLELNEKKNKENKKEDEVMTEAEIKLVVENTVAEMQNKTSEINSIQENCDTKIAEINAELESAKNEKADAEGRVEAVQAELNTANEQIADKDAKIAEINAELESVKAELNEVKAEKCKAELNKALEGFSEEEKACASAEIEAFNADPINSEINSVTNKIYIAIAKKAKADEAKVVSEQNSVNTEDVDIFGVVEMPKDKSEKDADIF